MKTAALQAEAPAMLSYLQKRGATGLRVLVPPPTAELCVASFSAAISGLGDMPLMDSLLALAPKAPSSRFTFNQDGARHPVLGARGWPKADQSAVKVSSLLK